MSPAVTLPNAHFIDADNPELEYASLCKAGPPGTYTFQATASHPTLLDESTGQYNLSSATYTVTVTAGSYVDGTTIPGGCFRSALPANAPNPPHSHFALTGGATDATVTVVETGIPSGIVFQKAEVYLQTWTQATNTFATTMTSTTTNSATGRFGGNGSTTGQKILWGSSIIFYNVLAPDLTVSKTAAGTYDIPVSWQLTKTVSPTSHTGVAGQNAGTSTWTVTATKVLGTPTNHVVSGTITVSNPAGGVTRSFTVTDVLNTGASASVSCPAYTVDPGASVVCTYSVQAAGATLNTATVSSTGMSDATATAAVSYTPTYTGDQSVTLADPRLNYSQVITSTTTITPPETFPCPSSSASYTNGTHTRTETNTATLTGTNTNLTASASVVITCTMPKEETATGAGFPWSATVGAPKNWFMYTPWVTTGSYRGISAAASGSTPAGTDLIAGQKMIAGRITGTRGTTTSITITLNSAFRFGSGSENVKIYPMSCTTAQAYVSPGAFTYKSTVSPSVSQVTVSGLPNTACYAIHVSVVQQ